MGRGYIFGLIMGAILSALGLGGASLMAPLKVAGSGGGQGGEADAAVTEPAGDPGQAAEAEAPVAQMPAVSDAPSAETPVTEAPATSGASAEATTAEAAAGATTTEAAKEPATAAAPAMAAPAKAPAQDGSATAPGEGGVPETPVVEVPAGSEFARAKPDTDPVIPAAEPAPVASGVPAPPPPAAEPAPALAEVSPAGVPEGQQAAPAVPAAPDAADAGIALAEAPAAEPAPVLPKVVAPAPAPAADAEKPAAAGAPATPQPAMPDPAATPAPAPSEPASPPVAAAEPALPEAAPEASGGTENAALPEVTIIPEPAPADEPADEPAPEASAEAGAGNGPVILDFTPAPPIGVAGAPQPGVFAAVPGVKVNRLPRISAPEASGDDGLPADEPADDPSADPAPETDAAAEPAAQATLPNAAAFSNPEGLPVMSLVLLDIGEAAGGVAPEELAALGAPVTVAVDPEMADAAGRARIYRLAGDEVAILAPDLPQGATASDLEVSYQGYRAVLPDAIGLVGTESSTFQSDRRMAQHLVALLGADGLGLLTYDRGLNPARQAAGKAGIPYFAIYRDMDDGVTDEVAIRRLLDRAAFEAARKGRILLVGRSQPETVRALRDWIAAGGKGVAVGPASAVMAP